MKRLDCSIDALSYPLEQEETSPGIRLSDPDALPAGRRPGLVRLLHCQRPLSGPEVYCLSGVDCAEIGRGASVQLRRTTGRYHEISLNDSQVSRRHARLIRRAGQLVIEDVGSKNGLRVGNRTVRCDRLEDNTLVELGQTFLLYRERLSSTGNDGTLPGVRTLAPELAKQLQILGKAARSKLSILLLGETGTGKEIVARAMHEASGCRGPFVAVNCGAIPRELVESELFGVRRGAYSGATESRPGYVREACGGTLFLDEVADLAPVSQAALLRVLQTREVVPVGDARPIPVDFRVIAATNRDIDADVRAQRFRADLFARIAGVTATLPPLRRRREDLGLLIPELLRRHGGPSNIVISLEAARALLEHAWPHNVRELENALQRAVVLGGERVERRHLPELGPLDLPCDTGQSVDSEDARRDRLESLLVLHQGNISAVARSMGKERIQIRRWLRRFGWDAATYRTSQ